MKKAIITGMTGQDGSYLAEDRQELGWETTVGFEDLVVGRVRADMDLFLRDNVQPLVGNSAR